MTDISNPTTPDQDDPTPTEDRASGLNLDSLRGLLPRVDDIGYRIAHHAPDQALHLTLDEACNLSALLYRVTVQGKVS